LREDSSFFKTCKHRYAEHLQWSDDISTIMSVDDPILSQQLKKKYTRAASASAFSSPQSLRGMGNIASARPSSAPQPYAGSALQVGRDKRDKINPTLSTLCWKPCKKVTIMGSFNTNIFLVSDDWL
jgi:hypothetical protein